MLHVGGGAHSADHPLRSIRMLVDELLREMSRDFSPLYATAGLRTSIGASVADRWATRPLEFTAGPEQLRNFA